MKKSNKSVTPALSTHPAVKAGLSLLSWNMMLVATVLVHYLS